MEANAEREIIEELHEQLAVLRDQLASARAREEFFQMLLTTDRNLDRESRLLALLEADRRELQALRSPPQPHPVVAASGPAIAASRPPVELHGRIVAALAAAPGGLTAKQLEAQVGRTPLRNVLRHLARRGRLVRLGQGRFGVADALVGAAASRNGIGP
jgi:hypothetical protein